MCLLLNKIEKLFCLTALPAAILFSVSCRHEVPVLKEEVTRFSDKTRSFESFDVEYDETSRTLIFTRQNWTQTEEKINRVDTGIMNRTVYGSYCSDFWMEYSLWNGEPRRYLMVLAVPPLTVYPIIDTVILAGCMTCDACIFPIVWAGQQSSSRPVVLPEAKNGQKKEIVSEMKMSQDLIYRDVVENRSSRRLSSRPIDINDSGIHKTVFTDAQGRITAANAVRWIFPIRNITFIPAEKVSGKSVQISTYRFLNSDQKKLWTEIKKNDIPTQKKLEAWEKLRPVCEPQYYDRVKSNMQLGFYF